MERTFAVRYLRKLQLAERMLHFVVRLGGGESCRHPLHIIQGEMTLDRQAWLEDAARFGVERFSVPGELNENPEMKLARLQSISEVARLDGAGPELIPFYDTLHAKAALPRGKGSKSDDIPAEIFRNLQFLATWRM